MNTAENECKKMSKPTKLISKHDKDMFWSKTLTRSTENHVLAEKTLRL